MKSNLPEGWIWVRIGDVFSFVGGGTPSKNIAKFWNGDIYWASVKDIKGKYLHKTQDTITQAGVDGSATQLAEPGDVLMITRMSPGRPIITKVETAINQDLKIVRPRIPIPSLFTYYSFLAIENQFSSVASGTTVQGIRIQDVNEIPFPLPPLAEQRRIVAKLDAAMQQLEASQARLEKLPGLLKQFRQAVLAAAVSGRLTEAWRAEHPQLETGADLLKAIQAKRISSYAEAVKAAKKGNAKPRLPKDPNYTPKIEISNDIPEGWVITQVKDVADCLDYIRRPINKDERKNRIGTIPYYGANGRTGWIDDYLFNEDLVIIVEDETFTGRELPFSYIIRGKSWVNNHAHVMRPVGEITADYLNICWSYYDFIPLTSGSTGRKKLTQASLLQAPFAIAPLAEQQEIVRQVNHYFALADALEARFEQAAALVEQLPQALLAKAFSGQLVPQDPTDEPASALLERLRAAPAPAKAKRGRKAPAEPLPLF